MSGFHFAQSWPDNFADDDDDVKYKMRLHRGLKRAGKALRNLIADPLPRDAWLVLRRFEQHDAQIDFHYEVAGTEYVNSVRLPADVAAMVRQQASPATNQLLTAVGIFMGAFFFRMTDFKGVAVHCAPLDEPSCAFFARYLRQGLGEFRYLQGLDPGRRIEIDADDSVPVTPLRYDAEPHVLLCNGGGKDSVVCGELLKAADVPFTWLSMQMNPARRRVVEISGVSASLEVDFDIDSRVEKRLAYPWGHVPRTPIAMALALLVSMVRHIPYVALGNERSANEGNVVWKGVMVNHQYAKSFEFERDWAEFVRRRVTVSTRVFSLLRPFHDLQLAGMLAQRPQYLTAFVSCNRGIAQDKWCKTCAKCAFTALALGAHVGRQGLLQIFGEDIFQRPIIRRHILDLLSGAVKPWECVGTRAESLVAIQMIIEDDPQWDFREYPRRADFEAALPMKGMADVRNGVLSEASDEHLIPGELVTSLNIALKAFSGMEVALPLGSPTVTAH